MNMREIRHNPSNDVYYSPMMTMSSNSTSTGDSGSSHYYCEQQQQQRMECPIPTTDEEALMMDQLVAMRTQERVAYSYCCFLPENRNHTSLDETQGQPLLQGTTAALPCCTCSPNSHDPQKENQLLHEKINISWREKICHWSYNVVDHFDISREVVAISLKLFDRYLATCNNKCNGNLALLASLTTLHIAIKLHETKKVKLSTLASLSRGQFNDKHIEEMEWQICTALRWKVHPPTEYSFLQQYIQLLDYCCHSNTTTPHHHQVEKHQPQLYKLEQEETLRKEILELSKYLTELCICDAFFVLYPSSIVAFAALLNVMEDLSPKRLSHSVRLAFLTQCSTKFQLHVNDSCVIVARQRIQAMFREASGSSGGVSEVSANTKTVGSTTNNGNNKMMNSKLTTTATTSNKKNTTSSTYNPKSHFEPPRSSTPSRRMPSSSCENNDSTTRMQVDTVDVVFTSTNNNRGTSSSTTTTAAAATAQPLRELTTTTIGVTRPRADSSDSMCSKGSSVGSGTGTIGSSYRYSPSPRRANRIPTSFTVHGGHHHRVRSNGSGGGRHRLSSSPIVAGVQ